MAIPYGKQTVNADDIRAVVSVLESDFLTQGPVVPSFEECVAEVTNAKFAVAVNSATSGLHIACLALEVNSESLVWTSPTTFVASANCARYCGAKVDFVDIDPTTGLMCTKMLAIKLREAERCGCLPDVVIPVHLCGTSCDMGEIKTLSDQYGFKIIEDASHAIGARYNGHPVGSCRYSDIAIFSFHPVKIITTGEGGLATTNDPLLDQRMKDLRSHGITKERERFQEEDIGAWSYEQQSLGFNYRMTDIQAALGKSQISRLNEIVTERHRLAERYRELLDAPSVCMLEVPAEAYSSFHLAVVRLRNHCPEIHQQVFDALRYAGIGVQVHYSPVHLQPYYKGLGFEKGQFPNAEAYGQSAISLPIYPGLMREEQDYVIDSLLGLLKKFG